MMFRHRPALLTAVALACGIYAESLLELWPLVLLVATLLCTVITVCRMPMLARITSLTIALVCLGALHAYAVRSGYEQTHTGRIAKFGKDVEVIGRVSD